MGARREYEGAVQLWTEVGAPYEAALARLGLAQAHRASANEERAMLEFGAARSTFERLGATHLAAEAARASGGAVSNDAPPPERARQGPGVTHLEEATENVLRLEGDYWLAVFQGQATRLQDRKGLRYLARLLAAPGREFHVLDMVAGDRTDGVEATGGETAGLSLSRGSDAGVLLDARAKES